MTPEQSARWADVWKTISAKTKAQILAKCQYEHMTRRAVVREWWPKIWAQVNHDAE